MRMRLLKQKKCTAKKRTAGAKPGAAHSCQSSAGAFDLPGTAVVTHGGGLRPKTGAALALRQAVDKLDTGRALPAKLAPELAP